MRCWRGPCREAISATSERRREISDRIDVVMTNKYIGLPLFFLIIYLTFWFTFTCADPLMGYIEEGFAMLSGAVKDIWPESAFPYLRSLLTDGVIAGVGGVLVFLPNILFLFFAIAILEDSGYMARAAFVMDGVMRRFGLQGRSFVPLVLGFGWAKPVPVDMRYFKKPKQGMALTALAGPVSNFVLALLALLCARLVYHQYGALWDFIFDLLLTTAYLSVGLGLFNLIPISPLDGSKVLFAFLPDSAYEKLMRYEKYGMIALLILVWLGVGDNVLSTAIYNVYASMINFVFRGIV